MATLQFDFDSTRNRLLRSLRGKSSWADILPYSTNTRLIDSVAESIVELAEYDEYLTRETKWRIAQNRSSLVNQADILNYAAHRKVGAKGPLRVSASEDVADISVRKWDETFGYNEGNQVVYDDGDTSRLYEAQTTILPTTEDDPNDPPPETNEWERVNVSHDVNIEIPVRSVFSDGGDLQVTTVEKFVLTSDDDYVDIDVIQGTPRTETREATGANYEEFTIENDSIDDNEYSVRVNGIKWEEVDDLRLSDKDDTHYEIRTLPDGSGVVLRFGNDIFGRRLESGDQVEFRFIDTDGIEGNVTSVDTINETETSFYDVDGNQVELYVMNDETIGGGKDLESIESIRTNAPRLFQTGGRATSKSDYQVLMEGFDFVSRAIAWGAYEYNIDNNNPPGTFIEAQENIVHVAAFTTAGEELSTSQKDEIRSEINKVKAPTDIIKFEPVSIINLIFTVEAFIRDRAFTQSSVKDSIREELSEEYDINNRDFAENLYRSDYVAFIDDIDGVYYHNTTIDLFELFEFESGYATSWRFGIYPLESDSVKVYLRVKPDIDPDAEYELVARDNGNGGLVGQNGYSASGSSVNYEFGTGTLELENPDTDKLDQFYTNYDIKIQYRSKEDNLVLSQRSQVFNFSEASITTSYTE